MFHKDKYANANLLYGGSEASHPSLDKDFQSLYLKYKSKYLNLKNLLGGSLITITIVDDKTNKLLDFNNININTTIEALKQLVSKQNQIPIDKQIMRFECLDRNKILLCDSCTLEQHNIRESTTIILQNIDTIKIESNQWFESLFGFEEEIAYSKSERDVKYKKNQNNFIFDEINKTLTSKINNLVYNVGTFTCPTLEELREQVKQYFGKEGFKFEHKIVGDIFMDHALNPGATFQGASQFNCLEFVNPNIIPENGITGYIDDSTQGPACALACAAGTVVRNYFVKVNGRDGQTYDNQINNLDEIEKIIDNKKNEYWTIKNGYSNSGIHKISGLEKFNKLLSETQGLREELIAKLKVGVHQDVGVNFSKRYVPVSNDISVTQVYASALSLNPVYIDRIYNNNKSKRIELWSQLAQIILEGAYEATLWAGVINAARTGNNKVFLTLLGGGVFENKPEWIGNAIGRALALARIKNVNIEVIICYFERDQSNMSESNQYIRKLINEKYNELTGISL